MELQTLTFVWTRPIIPGPFSCVSTNFTRQKFTRSLQRPWTSSPYKEWWETQLNTYRGPFPLNVDRDTLAEEEWRVCGRKVLVLEENAPLETFLPELLVGLPIWLGVHGLDGFGSGGASRGQRGLERHLLLLLIVSSDPRAVRCDGARHLPGVSHPWLHKLVLPTDPEPRLPALSLCSYHSRPLALSLVSYLSLAGLGCRNQQELIPVHLQTCPYSRTAMKNINKKNN